MKKSALVLFAVLFLFSISLPALAQEKLLTIDDIFDPVKRVNFTGTVPVGSRIRLRLTIKNVDAIKGGVRITSEGTMEIEGGAKPVLISETIGVVYD